jgi:hypothetical protein
MISSIMLVSCLPLATEYSDLNFPDLAQYTPTLNCGRGIRIGTALPQNEYSPVESESFNAGRHDLSK